MRIIKLHQNSSLFLDALRALSVQLVVFGHAISFCNVLPGLQPPSMPYMQNIAVMIFFVLSGFLISLSVLKNLHVKENYNFLSYFIDRFSRIYTAFIPALLLVFVLDFIVYSYHPDKFNYSGSFNISTFVGNIFMLQDFPFLKHIDARITSFSSARPFWTLAIEWWIYLWFGYLMIVFMGKKKTLLKWGIMLVLSIVPTYNFIAGRGNGLTVDWLFGGMACLIFLNYRKVTNSKITLYLFFIPIIIGAALRLQNNMEAYDIVVGLCIAAFILTALYILQNSNKTNKYIAKIIPTMASYSYTLYLLHYTIIEFIIAFFKPALSPMQIVIYSVIISNLVCYVLGRYTETTLTTAVRRKMKEKLLS